MKKVALIGDCHSTRILDHYNPLACPVELKVWGRAGAYAWRNDPSKMFKQGAISSSAEDQPLYYSPENRGAISFDKIIEQDLIFVWLGYIDIRQMLPGHKNADVCVKQYVERFISYFNNCEIRFIEPLPQFIPLLLKSPGLHPEYSYEERMIQNNEFVKYLKKYSDECGLKTPISQKQIFQVLNFNAEQMTEDKTRKNTNHPVDALNREHMGKIYNLFISEAIK